METITIFVAGRSKGDPGPAAIGVHVVDEAEQVVLEHHAAIGNATDDFATYQAVVEALDVVHTQFKQATRDMQCDLKLDNEFVKQQLNGEVPVTDPRAVSHFIHIHNLRVEDFPNLTLSSVSRADNTNAVQLAERLLDE